MLLFFLRVFKLSQLCFGNLELYQALMSFLGGLLDRLCNFILIFPELLVVERDLQNTDGEKNTFDLFLLLDAVVNLLLKIREPLELDLLMSQLPQLITTFSKILLM